MNITDLETGMIVEVRNGIRYLVLKNFNYKFGDCMVSVNKAYSWMRLKDYNDNLTYRAPTTPNRYDIVKVFKTTHPYCITAHKDFMDEYDINENNELELFWERPVAKKMSKSDIEEALGYEIEIVEEKC